MRRILQPFRENVPAGRCGICGETIYLGDVAYFVLGLTCCYGCIDGSAYVADGSLTMPCDITNEHLFRDGGFVKDERKDQIER